MHKVFVILACIMVFLSQATGETATPSDPAVVAKIVKGNTAFAVDLYHQVSGQPGNLFFSPLSMSTALAMTSVGARGETAQQMAQVLHLPSNQAGLHEAYGYLSQKFNTNDPDCELTLINALWGQKSYKFMTPFINILENNYRANLTPVNFKSKTEKTRQQINKWAEEQSREKIKELIAPGVLTTDTRLVLTNAVYFMGNWKNPFPKSDTREEPFYVSSGKTTTGSMMNATREYGYFEHGQFQALEMPYQGNLSMIILLPKNVDGLVDFEKTVTSEKLAEWLRGLQKQKVVVTVPRFKISSEYSMGNVLAEMGMPLPFSEMADFSGMTGKPALFISAVVHKGFLEVNEKGTEATTVTAVALPKVGFVKEEIPPPPPVFRADHPFLFLIRDLRTNSILFMGRVVNLAA